MDALDPSQFGLAPLAPEATAPVASAPIQPGDFGLTAAPVAAPPAAQPAKPAYPVSGPTGNWFTDALRRGGSALVDAATAAVSPALGHIPANYPQSIPGTSIPTTPEEARANAVNNLGGTYYQPATEAGRMVQGGLTAGIMSLASPESIPAALGGGATSQAAQDAFPNHPLLASMIGFVPGAWLGKTAANVPLPVAGGSMGPEKTALAADAQARGIPLAPGQLSDNPFIRYFYSQTGKLPFSGADAFSGTQQNAFNRAVSQTLGENADHITPELLQSAKDRIGGVFNDVASRTSIPMSNDLMTKLQNVVTNSKLTMSADSAAPVEKQAMNLIDTAANNGGNIGGRAYIDLTAKGGPLDNMMQSGDSGIRNAGTQLRGVLDDALANNAHPDDLAALQTARSQWKAMRTVAPLTLRADATGGGAKPTTGDISPAALRAAVNQSYKNAAFASQGDIPLNDLAKIGQRFLKEPPDSGTASRTLAQHALEAGTGLGAMMLGHEALGLEPLTSAAGAAGTLLANRAAQSVMRNQWLANRMIAASQNPNGFRFSYPWGLQAPVAQAQVPFSLSPPGQPSSQTIQP